MSVTFIDGLPGLAAEVYPMTMRAFGSSAFICSPQFICRVDLHSAKVDWLVERSSRQMHPAAYSLPRRIWQMGSNLWISEEAPLVAEILASKCGGLAVSVRDSTTGMHRWEQHIPIPEAADWAEPSPAWPGAQTEEIYGFLARDPKNLVVCLMRQTRRSGLSRPADNIHVFTLPPFRCQTDAVRFDPETGAAIWRASFRDVPVHIIERESFTGIWSNHARLGVIDFASGANTILYESPNQLGWPARNGGLLCVPWHSKEDVGVDWIDLHGCRIRNGAWPQKRAHSTVLHATEAGLALQTNDQTIWWLGKEDLPLWSVRAKPYIYRVHRVAESDVFIGTDGNGGRLLGFDPASGRETLNLKPALGGVGDLAKVPGHDVLVALFTTSRSYAVPPRLLVMSMRDCNHFLGAQCRYLLGTWQHGAVCMAGAKGERLAIIDIRGEPEVHAPG